MKILRNNKNIKLLSALILYVLLNTKGYAVNDREEIQEEINEIEQGPFIFHVNLNEEQVFVERQKTNAQRLLDASKEEMLIRIQQVPFLSENQLPYFLGDEGRKIAYRLLEYRILQLAEENNIKIIQQGVGILNSEGNNDPILQNALNLIFLELQKIKARQG